jgi:uncharacterized protein YybS (DUF2232 family)
MVVLGALAGFLLFGAAGALGAGAVLVNLFTPLPAAALGMRLGPRWGAAAVGLTVLAVLAASGMLPAMLYLVQFGLPGALLPWLMTRGVHWDRAVFITLGLMLTLGILVLLGFSSGAGQSPLAFADAQIDREIDQAVSLMGEFSGAEQSPEEARAFREVAASMGAFMHRAYPGMLVVVCTALQLATVGLLAFVVRPGVLPGPSFARWRSPELLIWGLIAAGFAVAFATGGLQDVAINVLIILLPLYFLQGLAVVEHFLARKGLSPPLRGLSYLFLLVINPLPVIVTGVGIFDLWADFRKPRLKNA